MWQTYISHSVVDSHVRRNVIHFVEDPQVKEMKATNSSKG